ncbi:hypothetical protein KOW79_014710 [Hemibagrus wyckioides]|uniref:Galectin n=1 Tax=Hemibagrus wyckioides TaxID=337641 RepID=A0A9D3NGI6_9TELE|nr:hypothetical protein KOW79_014710 [Hemibagrus wyckioides]
MFINGNLETTFKHRFTNLWEIDALEVSGDLRFEINLHHKDGIAFHYNRFDENTVVRNNRTMNEWRLEERSGEMPFQKGKIFQMIISCTTEQYNVFVNGNLETTYNHHFTNLWEIDVLEVSGDLSLTDLYA